MLSLIQRILAYSQYVTQPSNHIQDTEKRRNAQLIMRISLGLIVILNLFHTPYAINQIYHHNIWTNMALVIFTSIAFVAIYFASRQGQVKSSIYVLLTTISITALTIVIQSEDASYTVYLLYYLVIPILIVSGLLNNKHIISITAVVILSLLILPIIAPQYQMSDMPVFFIITFAMLLMLINRHRDVINKIKQERLTASEKRYKLLYEAISDAVLIHDDFQFIDANTAFFDLVSYSRKELEKMNLVDLVAQEDREAIVANVSQRKNYFSPREVRLVNAQNEKIDVELFARTFQTEGQHLRVVSIRDIRPRKEAEKQRVELEVERERSKMLSAFITDASHDLRTPLSIIYSSLHLLKFNKEPQAQARYIDVLNKQTEHMLSLVENLLAVSQLEKATDERFDFAYGDLNTCVEQAIEPITALGMVKDVTVTVSLNEALPQALFDDVEIKRVIRHLTTNAINYTKPHGSVVIRTDYDNDTIKIIVQDTGIGIAADTIPHIFDLFYRADGARNTDSGGMGLGLAICQQVVNAHGGGIRVESKLDEGSTFSVELPRVKPKTNAVKSSTQPVTP